MSLILLACSSYLIGRWTYSALQVHWLFFFVALDKPPPQTLVVNRTNVTRATTRLNKRLLFVLIVANPTYKQSLILFGSFGRGCDWDDLTSKQFTRIQEPQLFGWIWIPKTCEEPDNYANLDHSKADVVSIPRVDWNFLFPEIAESFTR